MVMKSKAVKRLLALKLTWEKRRNINHVAQLKSTKFNVERANIGVIY